MRERFSSRQSFSLWRRVKSTIWTLLILVLLFSCESSYQPIKHAYAAPVSPIALNVYGQGGSFTTNTANNGGITASSLSSPRRLVPDSSGGLYVSDYTNNRVLYYPSGSTTATRVYGQGGSFTTGTANKGGISATSLYQPKSVTLDASGNLYISDTGNNRVLYYPSGSTTATRVYGQGGSFTTGTVNAPAGIISATSMNQPIGLAVDTNDNLYVADTNNNRVLFFTSGSTTATTVYGQLLSFVTGTAGSGTTGLNTPVQVALDSSNNLYVAETGNNRVVYFPSGTTTATRVYGQGGSFTTTTANTGGISANSLSTPYGLRLDTLGDLFIGDTGNNRVLFFPAGSTTATRVYGQLGSFTTNTANNGGITSQSLNSPVGLGLDSSNNLYIADSNNNRVLKFQIALSFTTQPPTSTNKNTQFSTTVSLVDVGSQGVFTDFTGSIAVAIKSGTGTAGATLSGTTTANAVNGAATFSNLSINTAGAGYQLVASSSGVAIGTTNPFVISDSLLFTPLTTPSFTFTLNGTTGTVTSQFTFKVNDTLFLGLGWRMNITSTQFKTAGGSTLATTATKITAVSAACTSGQTCTLPTNSYTYPLTVPAASTAPASIVFYNAASNTGTGDVTVTTTFTLTVPPGTRAGTYTGVFTVTLTKGQ